MSATKPIDWNPRAQQVINDQIAAYDAMRRRCPVAYSDQLSWSLFRHGDVVRVLQDHETLSNAASNHLSIPNTMDPPEHTAYRQIVERYFGAERMAEFEPVCRAIAETLIGDQRRGEAFELMTRVAQPFALRIQCAFMGWPDTLHEPLREWIGKNHRATRAGDRSAMAQVAVEFDRHIKQQLVVRRDAGGQAANDVTSRLLQEHVHGRPLSDEEIVSIVRNWTVGELGTIAASVGILVHYLATHPALQAQLRRQPGDLADAIDEILRIHAPLIANRRVTTRTVEIDGRKLEAGERLTLIWAAANRDEAVFGDPDAFDPQRNRDGNLLYGAGVHVCPGAPLARLELRVLMEAMLAGTRDISLVATPPPELAAFPASGFSSLQIRLQ